MRARSWVVVAIGIAAAIGVAELDLVARAIASPISCPRDAAAIVVDTSAHRMSLCEAGVAVRELSVAIGTAGVDKRREGDQKTPLGSYPLSAPRPSDRFHTFILIGYPTAEQRAKGMTGSAVGIHGPSRKHSWLGRMRNWVDWTNGCIAVSTDKAIDEVAAWMTKTGARRVVIE